MDEHKLLERIAFLEEQVSACTSASVYAYICLVSLADRAMEDRAKFAETLSSMSGRVDEAIAARDKTRALLKADAS